MVYDTDSMEMSMQKSVLYPNVDTILMAFHYIQMDVCACWNKIQRFIWVILCYRIYQSMRRLDYMLIQFQLTNATKYIA